MNRIRSAGTFAAKGLLLLACLCGAVRTGQAAQEQRLRAYVTNFEGGTVSVVDIRDQKEIARLKTGDNPHGVAIAPDGSAVFVTNEGDGTLSFIDPAGNTVLETIKVGSHPQQLATSPDGLTLYVPLNADHALAVVDVKTRKVSAAIPVGRNPHIIVRNPVSGLLYVTCEGDEKIAVVDTGKGAVVGDIPVWTWPRVPAVTPDGKTLFQTIRWMNGALVVDLDKGAVVERVALKEPNGFPKEGMVAHGTRVTPDGKELWLTTQLDGLATVIDPVTFKTLASFSTGKGPNWIEFTPDGGTAVVSNTPENAVSLIDAKKRTIIRKVPVGKAPKRLAVGYVQAAAAAAGAPETSVISFAKAAAGELPARWSGGVTGRGSPKWSVEADETAPGSPKALKQSGDGDYPWCVLKDAALKDGFVEVKFKPVSGEEDRAGGLVWRWLDGDNYYVARANALEDNVTIYHVVKGSRRQFKNVNMKVASGQWHTLRVDFAGNKFKVSLDGALAIEAEDDTFKEAGAVGVWTKADSVTLFDDFAFGGKAGE